MSNSEKRDFNILKESLNSAKDGVAGAQNPAEEKEVEVYTMPNVSVGKSKKKSPGGSKGVGILILGLGLILLLSLSGFLYYYFIFLAKPSAQVTQEPIVTQEQEDVTVQEETPQVIEEEVIPSEVVEDVEGDNGEATEEEDILIIKIATTTEDVIIEDEQEKLELPQEFIEPTDSDGDGLSDSEEVLFGSDMKLKDSDGDGYEDLSEALNLYNPAGEGKILDNDNIEKYINNTYAFSMYYSNSWIMDEVEDGSSVVFQLGNNQFIQALVQPGEVDVSLGDWYKGQFSVEGIEDSQRVSVGDWSGIRSTDGLIVYLAHPTSDNIIVLTYNIGIEYKLDYKNVFEIMINSLEVVK